MKRIILHIDFDSYFASCEQQFDEKLRGKPIGVTATNGRTCIIAASREAKKLGIKSPTRTWEALQTVPEMIMVSAHFEKYWEITQKFLNIYEANDSDFQKETIRIYHDATNNSNIVLPVLKSPLSS